MIGCIKSTTSNIWNFPCLVFFIGFCPVIITKGIPPSWAYAAEVTKFVAPGPNVVKQTPAFPVSLP